MTSLGFTGQAENYPTEVAALSKKMVQATLEIYKNTWLDGAWVDALGMMLPSIKGNLEKPAIGDASI